MVTTPTSYVSLGRYALDASDAEKVAALKLAIVEEMTTLVDLGQSMLQIEHLCDRAIEAAEERLTDLRGWDSA